jgi:hypothetical protein
VTALITPGQWVVLLEDNSVWRVESTTPTAVLLEGCTLPLDRSRVEHLAGFCPPDFYVGDDVVDFEQRKRFTVAGFEADPDVRSIIFAVDETGEVHSLRPLGRRSTFDSGEDVEVEMAALWSAYATTAVLMKHYPLDIKINSLRHNIREAILNLHP